MKVKIIMQGQDGSSSIYTSLKLSNNSDANDGRVERYAGYLHNHAYYALGFVMK